MSIPGIDQLAVISVAAIITAMIHSVAGIGGGILMVAVLTRFIDIKQAVPVMACALLISHANRALLYWRDTDWRVAVHVLLFGCPFVIVGALLFRTMSANTITLLFIGLLVVSFPFKYLAAIREIRTGPGLLSAVSIVWGMLAGNVIGQGFFLAPFLLGTGIGRYSFVATLATVTLAISVVRLSVFGFTEVLTATLCWMGVTIGVLSVPGAWLGRRLQGYLSDRSHMWIVDAMTVMLIVYFLFQLARA